MTTFTPHQIPEPGSAQSHCFLCGGTGRFIHHNLNDQLFGASGSWNFKECFNPDCNLIWLDPPPSEEDLESAYAHYYTHHTQTPAHMPDCLRHFYHTCSDLYLARKYGYHRPDSASLSSHLASFLLYLTPLRRNRIDADIRYLHAVQNGRLLDVGCGAGLWIETMRARGWTVHGVDFDAKAVKIASQKGLDVQCGSLEQQNYPSASFDAITLNHVIEHLPNPVRTLQECARLLKRSGKLVVLTPNGASLGHRLFKSHWRGLEPPRHLQIFTAGSLQGALACAGFQQSIIIPQVVWSIIAESILLKFTPPHGTPHAITRWAAWLAGHLIGTLEGLLRPITPAAADCLIALATKEPAPQST